MWMQVWWPDNPEGRPWQSNQDGDPSAVSLGRPPTIAGVLAEIRTRGFYSEVPTTLVNGQSWHDLAGWWRVSSLALAFEPAMQRKLQWVTMRAAVLDEMEAKDPQRFAGWLRRQRPGRRYHRRR